MGKRAVKPPRNPTTRYLAIAVFTTLGTAGVLEVFDLDAVLGWTLVPLVFICCVLGILYTAVALSQGWIAIIGHLGQVVHFEKDRQPIGFRLSVVLYLGLAGPTGGTC